MPLSLYEIEIFKAGTRPASNGAMTTISPQDLQEVVDTYNPSYFRAPLVVSQVLGHDIGSYTDKTVSKSKELCHGIPKTLRLVGDRLIAGFDRMSRDFANWVRNKQIHSVSSSFYLPNSPNNPYPGKWSLRHIAGLGATPPACKGLAPLPEPPVEWQEAGGAGGQGGRGGIFTPCLVSFNEQEEGVVDFGMGIAIMGNSPWAIAADLFQRYREHLIESEDLETADRVLPADQIAALRSMAEVDNDKQMQIYDLQNQIAELRMRAVGDDDYDYGEDMNYKKAMKDAGMSVADVASATGMSEEETQAIADGTKQPSSKQKKALSKLLGWEDDTTDMSEELKEREADLRAREEALRNREQAIERNEVTSFVEGLVQQGRVVAAKKEDTITLLLNTPNTTEVEFSQSTGKKTPRQVLMETLGDRPAWNFSNPVVIPEEPKHQESGRIVPGATTESVQQHQAILSWCEKNNKDPSNSADYSEGMLALNIHY